jgi:putative aldouronate transport system permease protein
MIDTPTLASGSSLSDQKALHQVPKRKRSLWRVALSKWPLYVMLIPAVIQLAIFNYYPMYGLVMVFQNYKVTKGISGSQWVGLLNFQKMFAMPTFWSLVRNTFVIAMAKLVSLQLCALILALLLNEVRSVKFKRLIQNLIYLPYFLSWVVLGGILRDILGSSGIVNQALMNLGLKESITFLGSVLWFVPTLIFTNLWQQIGWASIIFLAALTGIDPELYEAAAIDGANRFERMWHITLPGIMPTVILVTCLNLAFLLSNAGFEQILNLYSPTVYSVGDILDTWVYREGLVSMKFSLGATVGFIKSIVGLILIVISFRLISKHTDYQVF